MSLITPRERNEIVSAAVAGYGVARSDEAARAHYSVAGAAVDMTLRAVASKVETHEANDRYHALYVDLLRRKIDELAMSYWGTNPPGYATTSVSRCIAELRELLGAPRRPTLRDRLLLWWRALGLRENDQRPHSKWMETSKPEEF